MRFLIQNINNGKIEICEGPKPKISNNEVLIKTKKSLISSGTERFLLEFGKSNIIKKVINNKDKVEQVLNKLKNDGLKDTFEAVNNKLNTPIQIGYCNLGVVEESLSGEFKPGDKVLSNGYHAEYVSVNQNLCVKVPTDINEDDALFGILGAIALNGIRIINPQINENIAVYGFGLIGNIVSKILKISGCNVIALDNSDKIKEAEKIGVKFINSKNKDLKKIIDGATNNKGVDATIVCSNSNTDIPLNNAISVTRRLGKIVLIGNERINLPRKEMYDKEIKFEVSKSYGPGRYDYNYEKLGNDYPFEYVRWTEKRNIETIINLIKNELINFHELIEKKYDFESFSEAYNNLNSVSNAIIFNYHEEKENINKTVYNFSKLDAETPKNFQSEISLIGSGNHASKILLPIFKKQGFQFNLLCGGSPSSSFAIKKKFNFFSNIESDDEIFNNVNSKNIIICTPHYLHADQLDKAIEYNKNVFIEKPLSINSSQFEKIKNTLARKTTSSIIHVNYNRRYSIFSQILKDKICKYDLPKTIQININTSPYENLEGWLSDRDKSGGIVNGEACHFIDLAKYFINSKVTNYDIKVNKKNKDFQIYLEFSDYSTSTINYFFSGSKGFPKEEIKIFCGGNVGLINNFKKVEVIGDKNFSKRSIFSQLKGHEESIKEFKKRLKDGNSDSNYLNDILETTEICLELSSEI
jgi:predicted dehydrogenase/threonine dehydrogenase-like Zn-dependent dehydrogenase